jgi:hypothetical protein
MVMIFSGISSVAYKQNKSTNFEKMVNYSFFPNNKRATDIQCFHSL